MSAQGTQITWNEKANHAQEEGAEIETEIFNNCFLFLFSIKDI